MSDGGIDIARVVSLIMENPKLIEEISALAKGESENTEQKSPTEEQGPRDEKETPVSAPTEPVAHSANGRNRQRLLGALKPYVSRDRAQAIDSMLSIVEILDAMKGR